MLGGYLFELCISYLYGNGLRRCEFTDTQNNHFPLILIKPYNLEYLDVVNFQFPSFVHRLLRLSIVSAPVITSHVCTLGLRYYDGL